MKNINEMFKNRKIDFDKLLNFGFKKKEKDYYYEKNLLNNQFRMKINITNLEDVSVTLIDTNTTEEYTLMYVKGIHGDFIEKIKEECNEVIKSVIDKCTYMEVFKSDYSKKVIKYVKEKYNDELEYLWEKFPNNAVFRNKDNKKWYAILLILPKRKLGIDEDGNVEIIDLRIKPSLIGDLIDNEKYFSGYHMNKKNWFTIKLDGSVSVKEICNWIDESYEIAKSK